MKKLLLILTLFFSSCSVGQNLTSYTVYAGKSFPEPSLTGSVGNTLEAYVYIDYTWNQIYLSTDNSTHKIIGVSDLLGKNSLRLGVRRSPNQADGLVAVNYYHKNGKFYYPALKDSLGKPLILKYETGYYIRINKENNIWKMELYEDSMENKLLSSATDSISISSFGRRLQGPYIEVGSSPSPWTIITKIKINKK